MTQRLDGRNPAAHIASWSASAISYYNSSGQGLQKFVAYNGLRIGSSSDGGVPVFVAKNSDPTVTIHCYLYGCPDLEGKAIHIPAGAAPEASADAHIVVISPDGRYSYEFYHAASILSSYPQGQIASGQAFDTYSSTAWAAYYGGASTEAYTSLTAGMVTGDDLLKGSINHALLIGVPCESGSVYPTIYTGPYDAPCYGGTGAPLGARLWLNMTDAQIDAVGLDPVRTIVAKALAHYGAFSHDSVGQPIFLIRRSGAQPGSSNAAAWQAAQTKYGIGKNGLGDWLTDGWPQAIYSHFAFLDPCVSKLSC